MKKLLLPLLAAFPLTALSAPPPTAPPQGPERSEAPPSPDQRERMEKHQRMKRVVGLAEELELTPTEALRIDEEMRKFDERRRPLRQQVADAARVLERAADGDAVAAGQVDQAVQRIFDARHQLAVIDREMLTALSKDLKPQQRARMAIFLARVDNANREKRVIFHKRMEGEGPDMMLGPGGD